jgi:hypothetical protein
MNLAAAVLHAVADLPLVNIQADVIARLHEGASFGVSESTGAAICESPFHRFIDLEDSCASAVRCAEKNKHPSDFHESTPLIAEVRSSV